MDRVLCYNVLIYIVDEIHIGRIIIFSQSQAIAIASSRVNFEHLAVESR